LGEYQEQTQEALQGIWPYIKGFNYVPPFPNPKVPEGKHGDKSIALIKDGKPAATGHHAILESGLPLEEKGFVLMQRGITI
jgi:hypothetical protein